MVSVDLERVGDALRTGVSDVVARKDDSRERSVHLA